MCGARRCLVNIQRKFCARSSAIRRRMSPRLKFLAQSPHRRSRRRRRRHSLYSPPPCGEGKGWGSRGCSRALMIDCRSSAPGSCLPTPIPNPSPQGGREHAEIRRHFEMRIVVHGQQAFGKAVLEALLKRGENVVAVYVAPEKPGAKADPLKEAALAAKLPVCQPDSYKKPEVWEEFKALKPDLQVMAFVTLFVPEEFLNMPTHGSIQYHPSLLPAYRGASAINWPIIKGDKETGLSIFWPDNGLDTGAVLLQKKTPIGPADTLGTVYFDRLFPMGVEAMLESVDLVKAGKAPRIKQDHAKATYEGRATADIARIDWGKSWRQIDPLVRGCNPVPGAWTTLDGQTLQIFEVTPMPAKDPKGIGGKYGEIVAVETDGFTVVCPDG